MDPKTYSIADWTPLVKEVAAIDKYTGKGPNIYKVFLDWYDGTKTFHDTSIIHQRCPLKVFILIYFCLYKLLKYYESRINFK